MTIGAVLAIASIGLVSCATPGADEPAAPTTLRIGWGSEVLTLDPPNESGETGIAVLHNVYDTLVGYDFQSAELVPSLAEKWDISDDGLVYTFHIDPDATFATGDPVTADDVLFSYQRVIDWPEAVQGGQIRPALSTATISTIDDSTVEIALATASASFLPSLAGTAASIISEDQVVEAAGDDVEAQRAWLNENTAGSGAYQLGEWLPSSYIQLAANESWWRGVPTYESVEVQIIEESSQQAAALQQGDINVALDLLPQQVQGFGEGFDILSGADLSTYYLAMNLAVAPFDSLEVRQAVKYAIDYDNIIGGLLGGQAERAGGVIGKGMLGHDPALADRYEYDPERARDLLEKAGYGDGFTFDLYYEANATVRGLGIPVSTIAEKIQADLAEVGVTLNIVAQDITTLFTAYRAGQVPALMWYYGSTVPDPDQIVSAHGDWNAPAPKRVAFNDQDITASILEARTMTDEKKRAEIYIAVGERLSDVGPYAFMFRPIVAVVTTAGLKGFSWTPIWGFNLS
ncbi:ABC transporter substrate-binding protein [Cryobacterium tagatosivorans]|uniref:ABC transporter substrate-binding protein n=1 Tax=Cryobacterium tagatosivorans TaxID=1259199 RepID=UPI00141A791B|nr:ABC transporter substrate-binding protein [Cryobacterium tagatosivorans]